jgi:hypothetical protein
MSGVFGAETFAEVASERMEPFSSVDLEVLIGAIGAMFEPVQEIVFDGDEAGWSVPVTVALATELEWLGQFVGVRREPQLTDAQFRTAITSVAGFSRGTPAALRAAAARTLTGDKRVEFYERDGDPYEATALTYVGETPSPSATEAAIRSQKPAGIILNYITVDGYTYVVLETLMADYAELESTFADYLAVRDN